MPETAYERALDLKSSVSISEIGSADADGGHCQISPLHQNELASQPDVDLCQHHASAVSKPGANRVRRRPINQSDLDSVSQVLHLGFPKKPAACFLAALHQLSSVQNRDEFQRIGFVLEAGTEIVGVLLTIFSEILGTAQRSIRCNMSCWYVAPQFRMYAPMLFMGLTRDPAVTLVNISPASPTMPTIEAQGFSRFSIGAFAGVPAISTRSGNLKISRASEMASDCAGLAPRELAMLQDHESYGCISLICTTDAGSFPLIFRRCIFQRLPVPCARLIYARNLEDISKFAGQIGRYLARRGMFWICVAAPAPLKNIPGIFMGSKFPMYFKGPARPRPGDLAYTEVALFGF